MHVAKAMKYLHERAPQASLHRTRKSGLVAPVELAASCRFNPQVIHRVFASAAGTIPRLSLDVRSFPVAG